MSPRRVTALLAVLALAFASLPAARASARAADALPVAAASADSSPAPAPSAPAPFRVVPLQPPPDGRSHLGAYAVMAAGAAAVAVSFQWQRRANDTYDEYLAASSPDEIARLYDRTARFDRLSSGALLGGEALVATGIWLRFLHHPRPPAVTLAMGPRRCALAVRF